jgi:glycosyltransferase involved in cell wall biosynthesis
MSKGDHRLRIAIFGGGAHTIPGYRALLNSLSQSFVIIVYSEFPIKKKFDAQYIIRSVPYRRPHRWILACWFLVRFFIDHLFYRFDVIHSHSTYPSGYLAILFKRIFKIPVVVCLDAAEAVGIESIKFGDLLDPIRTERNKEVIKRANIVTALTQFQTEDIKKVFFRDDIQVITRGINPTLIKTVKSTRTFNHEIVFLHVGYLHPVKDPITLVNCFHRISKSIRCKLIQVGQDYMNGEVQSRAKELGLVDKIEFYGFVSNEKIHDIYQQADVLLHTSLFESQAFVVNEALAHGLLVCGTNVGLLADLSGKCCITVPPADFEGLAQQVLKTINNQTLCKQLRENGLSWTREHDLEFYSHIIKLENSLL